MVNERLLFCLRRMYHSHGYGILVLNRFVMHTKILLRYANALMACYEDKVYSRSARRDQGSTLDRVEVDRLFACLL